MDLSPIWEQAQAETTYQRRPSRVLRVLARDLPVLLTVIVTTLAVGLLVYSPLTVGAGTVDGPTARQDGATSVVRYEPGVAFSYSFTIANTGRWGITVTGLDLDDHSDLGTFEASMGSANDLVPLQPFALRAGESRQIVVRAQMPGCPRPASLTSGQHTWRTEELSFSVLGVPRHVDITLPTAITVDVPTSIICL